MLSLHWTSRKSLGCGGRELFEVEGDEVASTAGLVVVIVVVVVVVARNGLLGREVTSEFTAAPLLARHLEFLARNNTQSACAARPELDRETRSGNRRRIAAHRECSGCDALSCDAE